MMNENQENLNLSPEDEKIVKAQIVENRKLQPLILQGDQYRLNGLTEGEFGFACVAKDGSECLLVYQNVGETKRERIYPNGLYKTAVYTTENGGKYLGETLMREGVSIPENCRYISFYFQKTEK